jgi:hypothetical protein
MWRIYSNPDPHGVKLWRNSHTLNNNLFSYIREEMFANPDVVPLINFTVRLVQEMEVLWG